MLDFVYGHDEEIAQFIVAVRTAAPAAASGAARPLALIDADGQLIAGLVYFNYDPRLPKRSSLARRQSRRAGSTAQPIAACSSIRSSNAAVRCCMARVRADNEHLLSQLARVNFNLTDGAAHVRAQRGRRALHAHRRSVAGQQNVEADLP